jgi:hypothetical protein
MAEIIWTPDGSEIFDKLIEAVPEPMREMLKPKLTELLSAKAAGGPVSADIVMSMVRDDLPEPQKKCVVKSFRTHCSKKNCPCGTLTAGKTLLTVGRQK